MAVSKYKQVLKEVWEKNSELFQSFFVLNSEYEDISKRKEIEAEFQKVGKKVTEKLVEAENDLCSTMENTGNRKFSANVAEKFRDEVRKYFKFIDLVGVKSS